MGQDNTYQYTTEMINPDLLPYYQEMLKKAESAAGRDYSPYGDQRLAGFTNPEVAAMQGITSLGLSQGPYQQQLATQGAIGAQEGLGGLLPRIQDYTQSSLGGATDAAGMFLDPIYGQAGQYGTGAAGRFGELGRGFLDMPQYDQSTIAQYSNPYTTSVIEAQKRAAANDAERQLSFIKSQAAQAGAFGGGRHGVLDLDVQRDLARQQMGIERTGREAAYRDAIGLIDKDRQAQYGAKQAQLAATGMGQEALQWGLGAQSGAVNDYIRAMQSTADIGQRGYGQELEAYNQMGGLASLLSGLGAQEQGMQYDRLNAMQRAGEQQRALQQAGMDTGYQDFLRQTAYPQSQISWFSEILRGLPETKDVTQSTMQQQPGLFSSILGTGISGLGMYNAMNQGTV